MAASVDAAAAPAGSRSARRSTRSSRSRENLQLFARLEKAPTRRRGADAGADRAAAATRRRASSRAATGSGSTSPSACSAIPPLLLLDEPSASLDPAPARAAVGVHRRAQRDGRLHHPRRRRGRTARRPGARPRRRRAAVRRHAGRAGAPAGDLETRASWPCALAPDQGSPDPAPLAAAGGAAGPLPGRGGGADRRGADRRAGEAASGVREPRRRRGDQPRRARRSTPSVYTARLLDVDRPDPRRHPRGGDREGARRRGAGRARDPRRRGRAAAGHARR